jgi:Helix-turn-helix.
MTFTYTNNSNVIKEIKKILIDNDISQRLIAERLGITPQGLVKLFNKKNFGLEDAQKILNAIDYNVNISFTKKDF